MTTKDLADIISPTYIKMEELAEKYPPRNIDETQMVTRFAPSPTGFLHTGSLFTAFLNYKFARDTNGIFYLRIEDTDQEREVEGSIDILKEQLEAFDITYQNDETYAPYIQSERKLIYDSVIHYLVESGKAYPCFCTKNDLEELKTRQQSQNLKTGYYGEFAKCRFLSVDEAIEKIKNNTPYVVRFKSSGKSFTYHDELRGDLKLLPNEFDIVIRKSDGLPTYHFAHACDDHYMGTTHVIRGEEWLASLPIHYELFDALGFQTPKYLHLPTIMKMEDGKRRKLSKRKDPEASVSYLLQLGYPKKAILSYLLTLANSNYEAWRMANKEESFDNFQLSLKNFSLDGALFDLDKLDSISKEWIAKIDIDTLLKESLDYARHFDHELLELINLDVDYYERIMMIGRSEANPRKDDSKYSDVKERIGFFYPSYYKNMPKEKSPYPKDLTQKVIQSFISIDSNQEEALWLAELKATSKELGFAKNKKEKETLGVEYMFSDYMNIIRLALCGKTTSPNLYDVVRILPQSVKEQRLKGR